MQEREEKRKACEAKRTEDKNRKRQQEELEREWRGRIRVGRNNSNLDEEILQAIITEIQTEEDTADTGETKEQEPITNNATPTTLNETPEGNTVPDTNQAKTERRESPTPPTFNNEEERLKYLDDEEYALFGPTSENT